MFVVKKGNTTFVLHREYCNYILMLLEVIFTFVVTKMRYMI